MDKEAVETPCFSTVSFLKLLLGLKDREYDEAELREEFNIEAEEEDEDEEKLASKSSVG